MASRRASSEGAESTVKRGPAAAIPEESLAEWFTDRAAEHGDRPAALVKDEAGEYESVTFEAFHEEARQVAGGLQSLGGERLLGPRRGGAPATGPHRRGPGDR